MEQAAGGMQSEVRLFWPTRRWRFVRLVLFVLLALGLGVLGATLLFLPHASSATGWLMGTPLLALAALLLWWSWRLLRPRPVLSLDRHGLRAAGWRRPLAWEQIDDAQLIQGVGQAYLDVQLRAPSPGRWVRWRRQRRINLSWLTSDDQVAACAAIHARLAPLRQAAGLGVAPSLLQAQEVQAFEAQVQASVPTPWGLYLVVAVNIAVWLIQVMTGIDPFAPSPAALYAWGGNSASAVLQDGEYWRLLTATVLHGGLLHLALNLVGLWQAGQLLCRWYGNGSFLGIYLASALTGCALSLHFAAQKAVAVGASGAVFGVLGAVVVAGWRHRAKLPALTARRLWSGPGVFVIYALVQGFTRQGVDNAAHVGGLLAGVLIALLLAPPLAVRGAAADAPATRGPGGPRVAGGLVAALVLWLVWSTPQPPVQHRALFALQAALQDWLPRMQAAEQAVQRDEQAVRAGRMSEAQFVAALRTQHIPAFEAARQRLPAPTLPDGHPLQQRLHDLHSVSLLLTQLMELEVRKTQEPLARAVLQDRQQHIQMELSVLLPRLQAATKVSR